MYEYQLKPFKNSCYHVCHLDHQVHSEKTLLQKSKTTQPVILYVLTSCHPALTGTVVLAQSETCQLSHVLLVKSSFSGN